MAFIMLRFVLSIPTLLKVSIFNHKWMLNFVKSFFWGWGGGREVKEEGDICIYVADSLHCMAETNTTLESNYTPISKSKMQRTKKIKSGKSSVTYLIKQKGSKAWLTPTQSKCLQWLWKWLLSAVLLSVGAPQSAVAMLGSTCFYFRQSWAAKTPHSPHIPSPGFRHVWDSPGSFVYNGMIREFSMHTPAENQIDKLRQERSGWDSRPH